MKYIDKKIVFGFVFGVVIGVIVCFVWNSMSLKNELEIISDINRGNEAIEAVNCYFGDYNDGNKIYCLDRYIRYLGGYEQGSNITEKNIAYDMTISYVRLALLYKKVGDNGKFDKCLSNALDLIKKHDLFNNLIGTNKEIKSSVELVNYVVALDNKHTARAK